MNKAPWIAAILGLGLLLVLASLFSGWGMMGPGMMWGFNPFGGFGMIFMSFTPVIVIALVILGIVWLIRSGDSPPPVGQPCPSCGQATQVEWSHCPNCGVALE